MSRVCVFCGLQTFSWPQMRYSRARGMTFLELTGVIVLIGSIMAGVFTAVTSVQNSFKREKQLNRLFLRAQHAMERISATAIQGITKDPDFLTAVPNNTGGYALLTFRLVTGFSSGQPVYDDTLRIFIYGDAGTPYPNRGVVIGRGPDLQTVFGAGKGVDGVLGTLDDDCKYSFGDSIPAIELLISEHYAPRTGSMLTIEPQLTQGLLIRFTLRLNCKDDQGAFILDTDYVLTEEVALRQ